MSNSSLLHCRTNAPLILFLVYIEDILIRGENNAVIQNVITDLSETFTRKVLGSIIYFLGLEAIRSSRGCILHKPSIHLTTTESQNGLLNQVQPLSVLASIFHYMIVNLLSSLQYTKTSLGLYGISTWHFLIVFFNK